MTLWLRRDYSGIEEITVDRLSAKSVWINGRRLARYSVNASFHSTWKEAHARLLTAVFDNLAMHERSVEYTKKHLERVRKMVPTKES